MASGSMASGSNSSPSVVKQRQGGHFQVGFTKSATGSQSSVPPVPSMEVCNEPKGNKRRAMFNSKALAAQKTFRARQAGLMRRVALLCITVLSFLLAWAIGHLQVSPAILVLLLVAMAVIWRDQVGKIMESIQLEAEMRVRRRKSVQHSETTEWVNLALNRWWTTCNESVLVFLKDYIEPLLEEIAPIGVESVELVECDLSDQTPVVTNMQVFDPPSSYQAAEEARCGGQKERTRRTVFANFDLTLPSPNSRIVIRARLGGKRVGYNTLVYVEGLHVNGSIHAAVVIDKDTSFPHIACLTATFVRRPEIWFSVRVLKGLKVMEVPLLKNWVHSFIMDIFTTLLVDPGKLTLDFTSSGPMGHAVADSNKKAIGVMTVTVEGSPPDTKGQHSGDPRLHCSLRINQQKQSCQVPVGRDSWKSTYSFLVYSLQDDVLVVKMKLRRIVASQTLALHTLSLDSLKFVNQFGEIIQHSRSVAVSNPEAKLSLKMNFTPLPSLSLFTHNGFSGSGQKSGVLYVHVHSGSDLISADSDGLSDPYCVVLANKKKVLTTHYILDSLNPNWERGVEFFVSDFSQMTLTFLIYDWDGPLVGDDLLGVAKVTLKQDQPEMLNEVLELNVDGVAMRNGVSLGRMTVSVVFRPVESVALSDVDTPGIQTGAVSALEEDILLSYNPTTRRSVLESSRKQVKKVAKFLMTGSNRKTSSRQSSTEGVVELSLIKGRSLVPKDSNGLSDPYIIVRYGSETVFKSTIVKKKLNPEWNENATLCAPSSDEIIKVECWDKDLFSDDFMGSFHLTEPDLSQFQNGPRWCTLQHVKTGEILIGLRKVQVPRESSEWLQLDEASRPLLEVPMVDDNNIGGKVVCKDMMSSSDSSGNEDDLETESVGSGAVFTQPSTASGSVQSFSPIAEAEPTEETSLKRRHTLTHNQRDDFARRASWTNIPTQGYDDLVETSHHLPRYHETRKDIERALKGDSISLGSKRTSQERGSSRVKQPMFYYNVAGQVIEADGLKGELDHLELYIKVRLNSRPSYQRQQRFGRGPVIHKTRVLRGSRNPQWKEDFMVKESSVPSDSLLTVDLKSGSKINIGTQAITLDKFFEGHLKATKSLDLGNQMKLRIRLTRQPTPQASPTLPPSRKHKHSIA